MAFRIYIRDSTQHVFDKTVTGDPEAARTAFRTLTERADLNGSGMLAVLNRDGRPVAHHLFATRPDGSPLDPSKWWRGRTDDIDFTMPA